MIRYNSEVVYIGPKDGKWKVECRRVSNDRGDDEDLDEIYDAVVICTGHFTEPRIAHFPGFEVWPGRQYHSHNYRSPEAHRNQVVVVIGGSISACDICKDLSPVAKEVHLACRSEQGREFVGRLGYDNVFLHPMIKNAYEDGKVVFEDGDAVNPDVIIHCTGYKYNYPFLHPGGAVTVDDNRVGPLYKHVFPPTLAPGFSFVGVPNLKVMPFVLYELQSKWIAGVLSEQISLPSEETMMEEVQSLYAKLEAEGIPKKQTHTMREPTFELEDWLAKECGCPAIEEWRKALFSSCIQSLSSQPNTYRDEVSDYEDLFLQAHQEFKQYNLPADGSSEP